jgi:hypothetical protein
MFIGSEIVKLLLKPNFLGHRHLRIRVSILNSTKHHRFALCIPVFSWINKYSHNCLGKTRRAVKYKTNKHVAKETTHHLQRDAEIVSPEIERYSNRYLKYAKTVT